MSEPKSDCLVLYHASCADGFGAAWAAWKRLGGGPQYLPVQYGEPPPFGRAEGRAVYLLDFSYPADQLLDLARAADGLTVLDHHKTAQAALAGLGGPGLSITFDVGKSGARLAWEYFHEGEPAPWLIDYVEDRDLWRWRLDWSREISAFVASHPHDFRLWDSWAATPPGCPAWDRFVDAGTAILRYQTQLVDSLCKTAREIEMDGHRILAANVSCLFSEVAGRLAEGRPFGAAWFVRSDGRKQWSLRSRDGGVDVSLVCKKRGGGGHRNAAGFEESAS